MARGRPIIRMWHRWFGLIAGVWLLLLAVTGSAITYYNELDTILNPDLRRAPDHSGPAAPDTLARSIAGAEAAIPGFAIRQVDLPDSPGDSLWLVGSAVIDGERHGVQAFSDPHDGRLLGWRESGVWSLDRRHIPDLLYGLHIDLLVAPWVTWTFGLISLLWLIDHALALILAVPRLALWREALQVRGRPGSLRRLWDWHRAPGVWAWPVTAMLALTGVTLAWPVASRDAVRLVAPVSERLDFDFPDRPTGVPVVSIDEAVSLIEARGRRIDSVRVVADKGVWGVRAFDTRDPDYQGRLWVYVDMADGRVVATRHDNGEGPGDAFFAWQYPLHSGQAFGEVGRALVFLGGLVTAALAWTGVLLWWRRRRPARPLTTPPRRAAP